MANLLSPGVLTREFDLTTIVPSVSTTETAFVGDFPWGPCNEPVLVDGEREYMFWFNKPTERNFVDFFTGWNFLNYGNKLYVVRVVDQDNANTSLIARNATSTNSQGVTVLNDDHYIVNYRDGSLDTLFNTGEWIGKYPGELGNSLKVSICGSANAFQSTLTGTLSVAANSDAVTGVGTLFQTQLIIGDILEINQELHVVESITSNTALVIRDLHNVGATANVVDRRWQYYNEVGIAPETSAYAERNGARDDEIHIVVVDEDGRWTGTPGEILESFFYLSLAVDAKSQDGTSAYYLDAIDSKSRYIRWASHSATLTNAGDSIKNNEATEFGRPALPINHSLVGGSNGTDLGNDEYIRGYDLFRSAEDIDISLILGGARNATVINYIINNIVDVRLDSVLFLSPPMATVVDNQDQEVRDIRTFRNSLPSSSYWFADSNWKLQYDKFNDKERWVPLNGDIAGLAVRTDNLRDPWWSFAGLNRGLIKNVIRLAWNPRNADRDQLYQMGINPVISKPLIGPVLWGDKTGLAKPSAFDRINVRRLFIVLRKAIAAAAEYTLFEFNDRITRSQFKNLVEPFLRDVQGRRGIIDFLVKCDEENNTPTIIDRNEFVADIYIKPNRVINFIYLNFYAVPTGIDFQEIVGQTSLV